MKRRHRKIKGVNYVEIILVISLLMVLSPLARLHGKKEDVIVIGNLRNCFYLRIVYEIDNEKGEIRTNYILPHLDKQR
ncbi:MAG: hypothetical protein K8T10_05635 [Candidatus Eremiobacteraeota bacterium]|nr:hypothetical protein [Candidatus Eremiobacteraeota bacterium]